MYRCHRSLQSPWQICVYVLLLLGLMSSLGCQTCTATVSARAVPGRFELDLDGLGVNDTEDATLVAVRAEAMSFGAESSEASEAGVRFGGGVDVEILVTGDDYFGDSEPRGWESWFFVAVHPQLGDFVRLPVRLGPNLQYFEVETPLIDYEWFTVGVRGSVTPEIVLIRSNLVTEELAIFGEASGYVGLTETETDRDRHFHNDHHRDDDTGSYGYGFEAGARYRYEGFEIRGSWVYRAFITDETDRDHDFDVTGLDNRFQGVALSIVLHF